MTSRGEFLWWIFIPMVVFIGLFMWSAIDKAVLFHNYNKTTGKVIGYQERTAGDGESYLGLQVQYQSPDGQTRETVSRYGQQPPPREQIGDIIPIWVSKAHPEQARIGTFVELWLGFTIALIIGGIFFLIWYGTWIGSPRTST